MMRRLSNRSLNALHFICLMGVCGFFLPFGYFGEWAVVLAFGVSFYLWVETDIEQARRGIHPNGNV